MAKVTITLEDREDDIGRDSSDLSTTRITVESHPPMQLRDGQFNTSAQNTALGMLNWAVATSEETRLVGMERTKEA